jgi:hypothetical protein
MVKSAFVEKVFKILLHIWVKQDLHIEKFCLPAHAKALTHCVSAFVEKYLQSCSSNRRSKIRTLKKRFPILLPQLREQDLHVEKKRFTFGWSAFQSCDIY